MANTIVVANLLQSQMLDKLDQNLVAKAYCNTQFEGELKKQGTTVQVPIFPDIAWTTGGTAGGTITGADFAVTSDTLTVAQVAQVNRHVQNFEEVRSNFNLMSQLTDRMVQGLAEVYDDHIFAVANAGAGTALTSGITGASDVVAGIEAMAVAMDNANVDRSDRVLFVSPTVASYIRQAGIYDATETGLAVRTKGYIGMVAGFAVIMTTNLPANRIIAWKKGYIHFVEQMNVMKIVDQTDAVGVNVLGEALYQAKVFSQLAGGVVTNTVA